MKMMSKLTTFLAAMLLMSIYGQSFNVTFQVDMNDVTGFTTPEVNGTFNSWCGNCNAMSDPDNDGVWEVTVAMDAGTYYYKYSYDIWGGQEELAPGGSCTVTANGFTNRSIVVTDDVVLPVVCWESCNACVIPPPMFDVTFQVDMNGVTGFTLPEVNGTFNNWCGGCFTMTDADADGIWMATTSLEAGSYEFKYAYDAWAGQENLTPGSQCTVTNNEFTNRSLVVSENMTLPLVCWESCNACDFVPPMFDVTFQVDMNGVTGFTLPEVNGTFNEWCGGCFTMTDDDADGIWTATTSLEAGSYEFKYAYDAWAGQENLTPGIPCTVTNFGFTNRTLVVSDDMTLPVVCWESCNACVVVPMTFDVTFQVDMNGVTGFTLPEVNGTFNDWCGGCFTMSDDDMDGIWTATTSLEAGSYEFKYAYDAWAGQENLTPGSPCTVTNNGFTNRSLVVSENITLPLVCWESCNTCDFVPPMFDITFQVDMNGVTGFTLPEVNGTFNNWCGGCFTMTDDDADGIWTATTSLEAGSYEFKYAYDAWAGQENLTPGSPCTVTNNGFTNRSLVVSENMTLPLVCWESCYACDYVPPMYNITFQVDMNGVTGFTLPEVNGTFNSWCGGCFTMTDDDADGIWTATTSLEAGSYEFKYAYDAWAGQENLTPGMPCTVTNSGFTNRSLVVSGDIVLPVVCWNSCSACVVIELTQMQLPVTFDEAGVDYGLIGFEGAEQSSIVEDPTDNTNMVAKAIKSATAQPWAGTTITAADEKGFLPAIPISNTLTTMTVRTWSPDAGIKVRLKIEDHTDPTHSVETDAFTTVTGEWETLTFDFSNEGAGTAALNLSYVYDKASIFFNYGISGAMTGEKTYYFDDIMMGDEVVNGPYNVTFQVDMTNVTGFTLPEVNGTFNNWCGGCFTMSDDDMDGIWTATTQLDAGSYEFKYAYDAWAGQETYASNLLCTVTANGFTNRSLVVTGDIVLPVVCWESCNACDYVPPTYDVTFQVDMTNVSGFTLPEVNGTFNNWCGGCFAMSDDDADGIWTATTTLEAGNYEFKYAYDAWAGQENLMQGMPCTVTNSGFTNRSLVVTGDVVLPVVCWESCYTCDYVPPTYNVTFQVDMSEVTGFTLPEINGTFNNWCGGCFTMTDDDMDGIWTASTTLEAGSYEFKYAFDAWAGQEALVEGMPCTVTANGFTNRSLVVTEDIVLPVVCWNSCLACGVVVLEQMDLPVTFEDAGVDYGVIGFEGAQQSSIVEDPTDNTNTVVKVIKSDTAQPWAGTTVTNAAEEGLLNPVPFTATETLMNVRVWSPDAGIKVRLKVEDHNDPTHSVETDAFTTVAGEWETLTFDFSNEGAGTAELNLGYTFDYVSIFFNYGTSGADAGEKTYYFDDVMFGGEVVSVSYDVTFQVDMNNVTGFTLPEVNGTFNNWCGGCFTMNDDDADGIWVGTASIPEGTHEYKFAYDAWAGQENLIEGMPCTVTNFGFTNRSLVVSSDIVLPVVCWESCNSCDNAPVSYDVTFQVDMNNVTGFTLPEVNGTFNNWCGGCFTMSDDDNDGIWVGTASIPEGTHEFKFAYDSWAGQENLIEGMPCTVTNFGFTNRSLVVSADVVLPVVCWASCNSCDNSPVSYNVTFQVDMNNVTGFTLPEVNGTFNNWCGGCFAMSDDDADGIWVGTASIPEGTHEYKFAYDAWAGQENLIEGMPCTVTNSGFTNRSLVVSADVVLPVVCWASCNSCDNLPETYAVTFQVDMNSVTGFTLPEVNGTFNNWCGGCFTMSDDDADGIWVATTSLAAGSYEFKFAYDAWAGSENLLAGSSCTVTNFGFTNRALVITGDTLLPVVCWASCVSCDVVLPTYEVVFKVDMNGVTGFTTPEVNGTFNNWCGSCFPMTDANSDGIWEATTTLQEGSYEYKFSYDNWAGQEELAPGGLCTVTNGAFTNRFLQLSSDIVLPEVCWESCSNCIPPVPVEVTFMLNVDDAVVTSAEVSGSFNAFCSGCEPMTSLDNIHWTKSLFLIPGVYEFYYTVDGGSQSEVLADGTCTVNNGGTYHRIITVTEATEIPETCWESCEACIIGVSENEKGNIRLFPNPAQDQISIVLDQTGNGSCVIYNSVGALIHSESLSGRTQFQLPIQNWDAGIYQVVIVRNNKLISETFVIER
jgi:1,4-alpha-glucan branching enzyme